MNKSVAEQSPEVEFWEEKQGVPYLFTAELPPGVHRIDNWSDLELTAYCRHEKVRLPLPVVVRTCTDISQGPVYMVNYIDHRSALSRKYAERYIEIGELWVFEQHLI